MLKRVTMKPVTL